MENQKSFFETRVFKVLLAIVVGVAAYVLTVLLLDFLFADSGELLLWKKLMPSIFIGLLLVLTEKNISVKKLIFVTSGVSIIYAVVGFYVEVMNI